MYILGITGGHNGTAALLKDGKIIACVSEERFSRIKNHVGFPYKSIKYLLDSEKISAQKIDKIILCKNKATGVEKKGKFFNSFFINYSTKGFIKRIMGHLIYKNPSLFEWAIKLKHNAWDKIKQQKLENNNLKILSKTFMLPQNKFTYADHHLMHACSTCFNLPQNEESLIFTLDAEGLGWGEKHLCATVSIYDGKQIKRIAQTEKGASLGYLYGLCTLYLGMKPNEHEFKVMGLAPYSKQKHMETVYPIFKKILDVEGLNFKSKFRMQYADSYLKKAAAYTRFDNFAAAIQKLTEDLTAKWVRNGIKKTNIQSIGLSGGVFMNVKANQKISELKEVKKLFIMPSGGDECNAIGACFYGYMIYCKENKINFIPKPLEDLYLGPDYSNEEIESFLKKNNYFEEYNIKKYVNIEKEIATLLSKNKIVARFNGRSEWGARALGNRSILSNPSNKESVQFLNELIKDRDFWMPFTPSILEEDLDKYIENNIKTSSRYMITTFNSKGKTRDDILAAIHPYDFTVRPQAVNKDWNFKYHKLISEFKKITGIGAVLNTSFNLHGEPNVLSPEDAMHTLKNSGLDYLAIEDYLISKK